jgi:hypothetical protein
MEMGDDLETIRTALERRAESCWARLEDAVSELHALHEASGETIVEHVQLTLVLGEPPLRPRA